MALLLPSLVNGAEARKAIIFNVTVIYESLMVTVVGNENLDQVS